jgi:ADP-glucose pyrophosphorylase
VTNSIIAQGCRRQGGRVERAIPSPGVWIEAEAEVHESILLDRVHIGRGAQVRRTILDHGTVVPPHDFELTEHNIAFSSLVEADAAGAEAA